MAKITTGVLLLLLVMTCDKFHIFLVLQHNEVWHVLGLQMVYGLSKFVDISRMCTGAIGNDNINQWEMCNRNTTVAAKYRESFVDHCI